MKVPTLAGLIDRRILVNYRLDPQVAAAVLPDAFEPKLVRGYAMAGICLIRLKHIRPAWLPFKFGINSENAAHRFAVQWRVNGRTREGVYIPRRDTSSSLNAWAGGRLFPGEHHHAHFESHEKGGQYHVSFSSDDSKASINITAEIADGLPKTSIFKSVDEASAFFEAGSLGYSATQDPSKLDGLELDCKNWSVVPLKISHAKSSYFEDASQFPKGSVVLDHALLMRGINHHWRAATPLCCADSHAN